MENLILKNSIALLQRNTADAVTNGAAINIEGVEDIVHFINATARSAGSVKIKEIQFSDVTGFDSANTNTYTSDDYLNKNDSMSSVSAIDQTSLSAVGIKKIMHKNLAKNGQKFCRVNTVASAGSSDVTYEVKTLLKYLDSPKVQS